MEITTTQVSQNEATPLQSREKSIEWMKRQIPLMAKIGVGKQPKVCDVSKLIILHMNIAL
jgi:hypothetical protein